MAAVNESLGATEQLPGASPRGRPLKFFRKPWLMTLFVIGAGAGAYWLQPIQFAPSAPRTSPAAEQIPVIAGPAVTTDMPIWLTGVGSVQPLNAVTVRVRVDGQLNSVAFKEGQDVHAGDLLASIDPRPFEALVKQAEANRLKDQAQLNNAQIDLARYAKLSSTGAAPSQQVDTLKAQVAALEATVAADQANIDTVKLQLDFASVTSPLDGRVGLRLVDPGSIVHANDANGLVTITQIDPISVIFSLPQDNLQQILTADAAGNPSVEAYSRDGLRRLATGQLVFIDSQIDQANGMIRLRATFANANHALWPGQFVSTRLLLRTDRNVTAVPARAVLRGQDGNYVYVANSNGTVSVRPVAVGPTVNGMTAVQSGIAPGDSVVLDGQSRLAPGASVTVKQAAAAQGAKQ